MDCFLKKIFDGKGEKDELVHLQFQKFSRGEFKDRAVLIYSFNKGKYNISTTAEYGNEFVRAVAERIGPNKTKVTGVLVSTRDLKGQLNFVSIKQFAGVKQYILDCEMTGDEILELCKKFPTSFLGFSFSTPDKATELKIKAKAPKSGKPSAKADQMPKADFCKLITFDKSLARNFAFDAEIDDGTKKAEINHVFHITDIILPKDEKDIAKIREMAERKGKIIRTLKIDEKVVKKEREFLA
jgi:hypothetical protein